MDGTLQGLNQCQITSDTLLMKKVISSDHGGRSYNPQKDLKLALSENLYMFITYRYYLFPTYRT